MSVVAAYCTTWGDVAERWPEASVLFEHQCPWLALREVLMFTHPLPAYTRAHEVLFVTSTSRHGGFTWASCAWWDERVGTWIRCSRDLGSWSQGSTHSSTLPTPFPVRHVDFEPRVHVEMPRVSSVDSQIDAIQVDLRQQLARGTGVSEDVVERAVGLLLEQAARARHALHMDMLAMRDNSTALHVFDRAFQRAVEVLVRRNDAGFRLTLDDQVNDALDDHAWNESIDNIALPGDP